MCVIMLKTEIVQLLEEVEQVPVKKQSKSLGSDDLIDRDEENRTTTPQDGAQPKQISATMIFLLLELWRQHIQATLHRLQLYQL